MAESGISYATSRLAAGPQGRLETLALRGGIAALPSGDWSSTMFRRGRASANRLVRRKICFLCPLPAAPAFCPVEKNHRLFPHRQHDASVG